MITEMRVTSHLGRFAIMLAFSSLLLLPFAVTLFSGQSLTIIDRGETVSVPRDVINAAPVSYFDIDRDSRILVSMPKEGEAYLGKHRVRKEALVEGIASRVKDRGGSGRVVYIQAGTEVPYGDVIDVLLTIREADVYRVGLVVKKTRTAGGGRQQGVLEVQLPEKTKRQVSNTS